MQDFFSEPSEDKEPPPPKKGVLCRVLLPLPIAEPYDYLIPLDIANDSLEGLCPGTVIEVPVGPRRLNGVVWPHSVGPTGSSGRDKKLRFVLSVRDTPPLSAELLRTIAWVADYTLSPLGSVLKMVLSVPDALSAGGGDKRVRLCEQGGIDQTLKITPARQKVLDSLRAGMEGTGADLARAAGVSPAVVRGLEKAGVIRTVLCAPAFDAPDLARVGPSLSPDQQRAAGAMIEALESGTFCPILLDGVTGAGKTEVYFEALHRCFEQGKQALVLLPEIALSAQWLVRFRGRFGVDPAQWHSDLTPAQRRQTWRAVALGRASLVIGARSALFLPFPDLGLIVVDEEHDASFKQDDGVAYHGRDMAVVRAYEAAIPVVLASATPALESIVNAQKGRYQHLVLPVRHGGAALPRVELVDLRRDRPPTQGRTATFLSPTLRTAVKNCLDSGAQALLFLNRRGYAPLTLCRNCGHRFQCRDCTAWLVEHRQSEGQEGARLSCHHCGAQYPRPSLCPSCAQDNTLVACGPGVERIAEEAAALFPEARLGLMTSDHLPSPAATRAMVAQVESGAVNLLVGTQVLAKGYHFPALTLVGVVDADLGLLGGDPRAAERSFQLLHQVAGRAGRGGQVGRVLIQTHDPDHPVMQALAAGTRVRFLAEESENRRRGGLPPYGRMVALILSSPDAQRLDDFCRQLAQIAPQGAEYRTLGPAPAPIPLLRGRHRRRFLLQARRSVSVQKLVKQWLDGIKTPSSIRMMIDVDPYSFF